MEDESRKETEGQEDRQASQGAEGEGELKIAIVEHMRLIEYRLPKPDQD